MDPVFATFIAKLFQNTFRNNIVKQNFKLTYNHDQNTLLKLVYKHIGIQTFSQILGENNRLDVFNSSSFMSNLLAHLIEVWGEEVNSKKLRKVAPYARVLHAIIKRISRRRSDTDVAFIGKAGKRFKKEDKEIMRKHPLLPFETTISSQNKATHKHILRKYKGIKTLPLEAITRSAITEHEKYTIKMLGYGTIRGPDNFKSVH